MDDAEKQLCAFGAQDRSEALRKLVAAGVSPDRSERGNVNMHLHSFFSYNAEGWSPSRIAWECWKRGLDAAGLIDFDVLDGLPEFLAAGEQLGLRVAVGLETRVFYPEFARLEIDSPGEPGVHYIDGIGFYKLPEPGTPSAKGLLRWREDAQRRNTELVARINPHVPDLALDYDREVLPLSPGRCPTERHIVAAYVERAATLHSGDALARFWSRTLDKSLEDATALLKNRPKLEETVRARFAKRGGFGYVQPTAETFPDIGTFLRWVADCGAIPMESWLDGTSEAESQAEALLECSYAKGCRFLNIIPDRNWNIADAATRAAKIDRLRTIVALAEARQMPLNIGTEMNKAGQPFADQLAGPVLREFAAAFHRGAMVLVGHTLCGRFADAGYLSPKAEQEFPEMERRNGFFAAIGALPPIAKRTADALRAAGPDAAWTRLHDALRAGAWTC